MQIGQLNPSCIMPGLIRLHWNCASGHWPLAEVSIFRTLFLLFTLFSCPAFAQQVGFGVKGGVRATHDIEGSFGTSSESSRYVVGPMVEATLPPWVRRGGGRTVFPFRLQLDIFQRIRVVNLQGPRNFVGVSAPDQARSAVSTDSSLRRTRICSTAHRWIDQFNGFLARSEHGIEAGLQLQHALAVRGQSWSGGRRWSGSCDSRASARTGNPLYALE
jgi:hypothetical protein